VAKKILVVDDEPDVLKIICLRLEKAGYDIICGRDGMEALDLARQIIPDLIVLDVYLPDMNGDDLTRVMKNDDKLKTIPIILVSATAVSVAQRARDCGAAGHIGKPFEPGELLDLVKNVLRQKGGPQ